MESRHIGTIKLWKKGKKILLKISSRNVNAGLMLPSQFGIRSMHFGTKLRGMDIRKGEGYGWDGYDHVRAKKQGSNWVMPIPVRDNDPKEKGRLFIRGNCYIRSRHSEIHYFDLKKWEIEPSAAKKSGIIDIDLDMIPTISGAVPKRDQRSKKSQF